MIKLRSTIKPDLLNKALKQGMMFASLGCFILVFSAVFIPEQYLKTAGLPIVLNSILLITYGLYPYQMLNRLTTTPHEITFLDEKHFLFAWKRKPFLTVPFSEIIRLEFLDSSKTYGIALDFRDLRAVKACVEEADLTNFMMSCKTKYGCDLFLPYFTKRSFEQFMKYQADEF